MASPRDHHGNADGVVIVPPTYYRPTTDSGVPGNAVQTSYRRHHRPQDGSTTPGHRMTGAHGLSVRIGGVRVPDTGQMPGTHLGPGHSGSGIQDAEGSRVLTGSRIPGSHGSSANNGGQIPSAHRPADLEQLQDNPDQEFPTMADRLLAMRARRTATGQTSGATHVVQSCANRNTAVTSRPVNRTSGHVVTTSHGSQANSGTIRRSGRTRFVVKVFTAVSCLVGLLLMVISIAFLTRSTASNVLHDIGVILVVISSVLLVTAIVVYLFYRLGVCLPTPDKPRHIEVRSVDENTRTKPIQKIVEPKMFRPEPAPGYHTPLPFGPVAPGYIPPQIIYSQYAKKSFNHREILSGIQSPVNIGSLDDLPSEFRAFSMKTPRDSSAESPVAGPSMGWNPDRR